MDSNTILGVVCTISLLLPVGTIAYYKLYPHRSLAALGLSYLSTALYNLMSQDFLPVSDGVQKFFGVLNNYLDVPLILTALLFFCPIRQKQKPVHMVTLIFIAYELVIALIYGFTPESIVYIMGPGLTLILFYTFYLFTRQVKITVVHGKNAGRALMLAAILFGYGSYGLVYFFYYIQKTPNVADTYLLYFITSIVSCFMMTIGLHLIRKRLKQLQEVKNTRRELAVFFGN